MLEVYPAPAIVLGVGRFGLAVCERLGEEWLGLKLSGADASIKNLRLLAVSPERPVTPADPDAADRCWGAEERAVAHIARLLGEGGNLPSLALDLALLRTLGLVRHRRGRYEVAIPRDEGADEAVAGDGSGETVRFRRRSFVWLPLSPDPMIAAERLRHQAERVKELDLFITPLLNRVRQGHSPETLLAMIGRCGALLQGRDPTPWGWLGGDGSPAVLSEIALDRLLPLPGEALELEEQFWAHLRGEPVEGWDGWLRGRGPAPLLRLGPILGRDRSDPVSPLDPAELLRQDWETTGWASEEVSGDGGAAARPFRIGPADGGMDPEGEPPRPELRALVAARLGLFDHDDLGTLTAGGGEDGHAVAERLPGRLESLGKQVYRGLVRLWVDLQRSRVDGMDVPVMVQARHRDQLDESLRQSLEILGELLVRPLVHPSPEEVAGAALGPLGAEEARPASSAETELREVPSHFLRSLQVEEAESPSEPRKILARRLEDLGLATAEEAETRRSPLFREIALGPPAGAAAVDGGAEGGCDGPRGLEVLRDALNRQVRELFDHRFLAEHRHRPTRQPPRLTLFVVADMSEVFSRVTVRAVLREIHRELLRSFTPIFQTFRQGFDRALCVTPILWTPHPADPFQGPRPGQMRPEEAAIIDSIHGVRRWVESVLPPGRRFISQIFLNSRVTETSSLSLADTVRQTHDFLSFQTRNDLSADQWLRRTSTGSGGGDLFSSFACEAIEFPALRCREYLANRLARGCLGELLEGPDHDPERPEGFEPPAVESLVDEARVHLAEVTELAADRLAERVHGRLEVTEETPATRIAGTWDGHFEAALLDEIQTRWRQLTARLGRVDELVDELRLESFRHLVRRLDELHRTADRLVEENARRGGAKAVQAGFQVRRSAARDSLEECEAARKQAEEIAERHRVPRLEAVRGARRGIVEAARRKPDRPPMRLGLAVWVLSALALGPPLAHAVALGFDLHRSGGPLELVLGPGGGVVAALLLGLPAWWLLRRHLRSRTAAVRTAVDRCAESVRRLLRGRGSRPATEAQSSVRSFLESRLELTGAVSVCGFALALHERAAADARLGDRLRRSLDIQKRLLCRRAEDLGVRPTADGRDDLESLFEGHGPALLITSGDLERYFRRDFERPQDLEGVLPELIETGGGFTSWRREACLADSERLLGHCRREFEKIAGEPISDQHSFAGSVSERLLAFVARTYPNQGFGAEFKGYEGLDPDGVQVLADAALVAHPELVQVFEDARRDVAAAVPTTQTMEVRRAALRPNVAYMMSLVQGIRVHSLRNLVRFESFHDRVRLPDDRTFPLSHEAPRTSEGAAVPPINSLTGYEETARRLSESLFGAGPRPIGVATSSRSQEPEDDD